ncbi:hypothetical protein [Chitinimonas lacunae]|uniref:Thiazolylpeptide-type bacteriocin n=1 Tax=Chitinimonas lacunae TaxID=1963018 RepID=A0ABV8ML87_9NEIS
MSKQSLIEFYVSREEDVTGLAVGVDVAGRCTTTTTTCCSCCGSGGGRTPAPVENQPV